MSSQNNELKLPTYIYRQISNASMIGLNQWWQTSLGKSFVYKLFLAPLDSLRGILKPKTEKLGIWLQKISLFIALVLLLALGLPQFANDKIGLALISLAGLGSWIMGWMLGGKSRKLDIVDFLVLLYLAFNIVAACASHYFLPSLKGLSKVIIYIGSYFLFASLAGQSRKNSIYMLASITITGLCLAAYGLYQYKVGVAPLATWEDPSIQNRGTRIYSTLGNPNLLAGFLIPIAPIALGLSAASLTNRKWLYALLALGSFAVIALATILTGSRGGYIGLFAALFMFAFPTFIYVWKQKKNWRPAMVILVVLALALGTFALFQIPAFQTRLESIFAGRDHSSNSYRLNVWASSFEMFKDNWWFGSGVGNETFRLAYGLYMVSGYDALGTYCVPLEIAVECGIFALILFLSLINCLMARAHLIFWSKNSGPFRWIVLGLAAAIIGLMIHGIVDTVFYRPQVHFIFWLLVGIFAMSSKFFDSRDDKLDQA